MKLNSETFDRVKMMLESHDREDIALGLATMNTTEFKDNMLYILLMAKEANVKYENMWRNHADIMHNMFIQLGIDLDKPITFETIIHIAKTYEASLSDIQFIMDRYADEMRKYLNLALGLKNNPIKNLTIKINDYDLKGRTTSSDIKGTDIDGSILRDVPDNVEQKME